MGRQNVPLLAMNRGLISSKALARVDIDRTRLSAEIYLNWLPSTQGSMALRPGTKYFGSSLRDTGAEYLEFIAATDDVALIELTSGTMRIWLGSDAHELELLSRPAVDTTVSLSDTGWVNASTGGSFSAESSSDILPIMTGTTTSGVEITASSQRASDGFQPWKVGDDDITTAWHDTGPGNNSLPSWLNVDFGAANTKAITSYSVRASHLSGNLDNAPTTWRLIASNHDTGTFATDTGKWALQDSRTSETGWALSEKRTYTTPEGDTGTVTARRHWRLFVTAVNGDTELVINEVEMFTTTSAATNQVQFQNGSLVLDAISVGAVAKAKKRVVVSDTGTEHSLDINVARGPVTLRVGSTDGDDDYVGETSLGTGYHNLAFTPQTDFWIILQNDDPVDRIVSSLTIGDSGTVEVTTPWGADNLADVRYDQSADVVYVDCDGVRTSKIERRGTGRSWSVVDYAPTNGPFLVGQTSTAKLAPSHFYGNTTMQSNLPFFSPSHVGALFKLTHSGQNGEWALGALDAATDAVQVTGVNDTGNFTADNERRVVFTVSGIWAGTITIERSFDGPDFGFKKASVQRVVVTGNLADTGTFTTTIDDLEDNLQVWYRAKVTAYTSGVPIVNITYRGGSVTGIAKVIAYNDNQNVDIEVIRRFSDTGNAESWQEGYWSNARGFPTAVALHGGRLAHANGANLFLSVSDDFENFDPDTQGDAGPIIRTLGSGPVDDIHYLISLLRLIVGTTGAEIAVRSSSLDEPLTPDNSSASAFSTQGSKNLRAVKMDTRGIMAQRSGQRVFMIGPAQNTLSDYEAFDLTLLVPDILSAGVVSVAIQRQPDTRVHAVLADGTVAILTYEPQEEVICWTKWDTDGFVEKAAVLPGIGEDAVYYHIRRTINGTTRRYLEKWAMESECLGDTGLSWLADCAVSYTDTGRTSIITGLSHLVGEQVIVWADDTGQATAGKDLSPGVGASQTTYLVDTGFAVNLSENLIPTMTSAAATDGVLITASSQNTSLGGIRGGAAWNAADGSSVTYWQDTGVNVNTLPSWWNVDYGSGVTKRVMEYTIRVGDFTGALDNAPISWRLLAGNFDTGTFATDTGKWAMEDQRLNQASWSIGEIRSFTLPGADTGTVEARRHWRLLFTAVDTGFVGGDHTQSLEIAEIEMFDFVAGGIQLNEAVHHAVVGLPYTAVWKSSKLAYAAEAGTALIQKKRFAQVGIIANNMHARGLEVGNDTGTLDGLPAMIDNGAAVDPDKIFGEFDQQSFAANGQYTTDERLVLRATAPRPCTVLAAIVSVATNERV